MNIICRRIWDKDLNVSKWAGLNSYSPAYVQAVISGKRGVTYSGKAKQIILALKSQGFMTQEEVDARILISREESK